jgi:hypothetical protein
MTYDNFVQYLLDGDSWSEFLVKMALPPVAWLAQLKALPYMDKNYQEVKELLPPSYRDNFYNDDNGNMFIEKAGVKYPVYIKGNYVAIEIDGSPYKLEDVEF